SIATGFTASIRILDKIIPGSDSVTLGFKAVAKDIFTLPSNTLVTYTLGDGDKQIKGKLTTDVYGGVTFKLPVKQLDVTHNKLRLRADFNNETRRLQLSLPVNNNTPIVNFFPEGGSLTNGKQATVGWEVRDVFGDPLQVSAILYRDMEVVDTIQTNGYGMGKFTMVAEKGVQYHVKILKAGQENIKYPLPLGIDNNISISVLHAVSNDTISFRAGAAIPGSYYALVHNYTENFISFPMDLRSAGSRNFIVPLAEVPKGVVTLTIVDSLGRPVAERLFFAHYNKKQEIEIRTDAEEYPLRGKVTLQLTLKDAEGKPVNGLVSVACVQSNRIDVRKQTDIESYTYLGNELALLPFKKDPMGRDEENLAYLEDVLLIKGWRRYTWSDLMLAKPKDTMQNISSIAFDGAVIPIEQRKKIKKPIVFSMLTDHGLEVKETDSVGKFKLKKEDLISQPDKKIFVFLDKKYKDDYRISLEEPYHVFSTKLAGQLVYEDFEAGLTEKNTDSMVLKKGERAETLQEVIVRSSKKDNSFFPQKNACGDYVCMYNVLNCPNHPYGGTLPVKGKIYHSANRIDVMYAGCVPRNDQFLSIKGIYSVKEFYNTDYTQLAPSEQSFLSTIFWDYSVSVSTGKPSEIVFYTSDIPGKFKVIVQGVTTAGVVHGEYVFNVVK
ncbi:MAG: hypothetical protein ABI581_17085, partial [Sediminibacterium sp.]